MKWAVEVVLNFSVSKVRLKQQSTHSQRHRVKTAEGLLKILFPASSFQSKETSYLPFLGALISYKLIHAKVQMD